MAVYEIPLTPTPQTFGISLGGTPYQLTLMWRDADEGGWVLDVATQTGEAIVSGIPLVAGSNLLAQYAYLGLTGALVVQTDNEASADPTFDNLGSLSHVYFVAP